MRVTDEEVTDYSVIAVGDGEEELIINAKGELILIRGRSMRTRAIGKAPMPSWGFLLRASLRGGARGLMRALIGLSHALA